MLMLFYCHVYLITANLFDSHKRGHGDFSKPGRLPTILQELQLLLLKRLPAELEC